MKEAIEFLWDLDFHISVEGNDEKWPMPNAGTEKSGTTTSSEDEDSVAHHHHSDLSSPINEKRRKTQRRLDYYRSFRKTFKHLMKNDVRKLFPTMYCNALNGGDFKLFSRFVSRCMASQCEYIFEPLPQIGSPFMKYEGSDEYANRAPSFFAHLPDHALIPVGSRIIRKLLEDDISVVELYANAKATRFIYPEGQQLPDCEGTTSTPGALVQPTIVSVDFYMKISFHFNRDGYVVKTITSTVNLVPSITV
eukprot:scaffold3827_cov191-Ochromonas_danica.AAC.7